MAGSSDLTDSWVANADAWTRAVRDRKIESRRVATDDAIIAAALERHPASVLDLGCGEGWLSRKLAHHGIAVTGIDGSAPLIEAAAAAGGGTFRVLDYAGLVADPPSAGGPFDLVIANFALLAEDLEPLLLALQRLIPPDGALLIQTVHPSSVDRPEQEGWRIEDFSGFGDAAGEWAPMPWYFRPTSAWRRLLGSCGYRDTTIVEIAHPVTGRPVSLMITARTGDAAL